MSNQAEDDMFLLMSMSLGQVLYLNLRVAVAGQRSSSDSLQLMSSIRLPPRVTL